MRDLWGKNLVQRERCFTSEILWNRELVQRERRFTSESRMGRRENRNLNNGGKVITVKITVKITPAVDQDSL